MTDQKQERPRLITLLTILLLLQALLLLFLGLNLMADHWTFLLSWNVFMRELGDDFQLVLNTPGEIARDEILFYNSVAFVILVIAASVSLIAGITFNRGGAMTWILSQIAQIATLVTGIGLYLIHRPSQAYWLMAIGVLMVLYLNYGDVRQWFLQGKEIV